MSKTNYEKIMEERGITPEDEVCFNCEHMKWRVALGGGVACGLTGGQVPGLTSNCNDFEMKVESNV